MRRSHITQPRRTGPSLEEGGKPRLAGGVGPAPQDAQRLGAEKVRSRPTTAAAGEGSAVRRARRWRPPPPPAAGPRGPVPPSHAPPPAAHGPRRVEGLVPVGVVGQHRLVQVPLVRRTGWATEICRGDRSVRFEVGRTHERFQVCAPRTKLVPSEGRTGQRHQSAGRELAPDRRHGLVVAVACEHDNEVFEAWVVADYHHRTDVVIDPTEASQQLSGRRSVKRLFDYDVVGMQGAPDPVEGLHGPSS